MSAALKIAGANEIAASRQGAQIVRLADRQGTGVNAIAAARLATQHLNVVNRESTELSDRWSDMRQAGADMAAATLRIKAALEDLRAISLADLSAALQKT